MKTALPVLGSAVAVGALAVAISVALPVDRPAHHESPRPLHLAAGGAVPGAVVAAPGGAGGYVLAGSLPTAQPADASAYALAAGPADEGLVSRLAAALHAGTPVRVSGGWRAGGLVVGDDAGQSWWFAPCAAREPLTPTTRVGCAEGGVTAPAPPPMAVTAVRTAVQPVLDALGLGAGEVQAWSGGGSVTVARTVGGLEVVGLQTSVQVGPAGTLTGASGWLGGPRRGDDYPLVTAGEAFRRLPPYARPMIACPVGPDGRGCPAAQPPVVTGARLGLVLAPLAGGGQELVPAWLFDLKGSRQPVPVVAVQSRYVDTR